MQEFNYINSHWFYISLIFLFLGLGFLGLMLVRRLEKAYASFLEIQQTIHQKISEHETYLLKNTMEQRMHMANMIQHNQDRFIEHAQQIVRGYLDQILTLIQEVQVNNKKEICDTLLHFKNFIGDHMEQFNQHIHNQLTHNFDKANTIYQDVLKRLTLIDVAQKKISELSGDIISLQDILSNKQTRGLLGETQLANIIKNLLPASNYRFQHSLSNGKRADCLLILPETKGSITIDAKFPLENYQESIKNGLSLFEKENYQKKFKQDIANHIKDIANKYIVQNETADYALMFIPAESIFLDICHNYPDLIEQSHRLNVWLVSPTTMMAILRAISLTLKDHATHKQVLIIQEHLKLLAKDFERFQKRMQALSDHIRKAHEDVEDIHISAKKITTNFQRIEKVEIKENEIMASINFDA